jgi:hypothetical protein
VTSTEPGTNEADSLPETLVKYLPPARLSVLRDLEIRFTQASSLNDNLELRPPLKGVAAPDKLKQIVRGRLEPGLWSQTSAEQKRVLDERFPGLTDSLGELFLQSYTEKAMDAIQTRHENNPTAVFDATDRNFGILSLAESATDVRMWSHYADGGRGFLIEFDPTHRWFHAKRETRDSFRHLRKVDYVSTRPAEYLLDTNELQFLYTKWAVWQDEREWRIIRNFNEAARKIGGIDLYGNEILLFSIPPDSIIKVILGYSAKPQLKVEISTAIATNAALAHVSLWHAIQSTETGEISIVSTDSIAELTKS